MTKRLLLVVTILLVIYIFIPEKTNEVFNEESEEEIKGIFITYMELEENICNHSEKESKKNIVKMINNIEKDKFNTIYLQARSHMDSIYNSSIFPVSKNIILSDNTNYDVLDYFLKKAHSKNIKVYAWVNPFRIGNKVNENSTYYKRVKNDIKNINGMYFLNPASNNVVDLIVDGVAEIVKNYEVDGIMFDDYFYPSNDIDIDDYSLITNGITIEEYHLQNINKMVRKVYEKIKKINGSVSFGVSPEANIENDYSKNFADVKRWGKEYGYVDFLMPQIYYGFDNSSKPFNNVLEEWSNLISEDKKLIGALALYKTGKEDVYAKDGIREWINNSDVISRQILELRKNKKYSGFCLFRYDNFYNENSYEKNTIKEIENIKKVM